MKAFERERRDWIIIPIILVIGFLCVILAAGWALRFPPTWKLNANMESMLDPNSDFLTRRPGGFVEPIDPSILTQPGWIGLFLTPGATYVPRTPLPTSMATIPVESTTAPPATNTIAATAIPTNTLIWLPAPPATSTRRPENPTSTPMDTPTDTPTDTPLPTIDLEITLDDGGVTYPPGGAFDYTVVVTNNSDYDVTGATVNDLFGAQVTGVSWICAPGPGTTCSGGSGIPFTDTINLPAHVSVTYTITVNVSGYAAGPLENTATVSILPFETDPADNTATITTAGPGAAGGEVTIGPGDGVAPYLIDEPAGNSITMVLSPGVAHSFVFYERYSDPGNTEIAMDWVQIEISADGNAWDTVFWWGDPPPPGTSDFNTNVSLPSACGMNEDDNCVIPAANLYPYPGTGITIDLDLLGYTGTYPWVRITCPTGDPGADGCDIDAINPSP